MLYYAQDATTVKEIYYYIIMYLIKKIHCIAFNNKLLHYIFGVE